MKIIFHLKGIFISPIKSKIKWPPKILAHNRIPKVKGRIKFLKTSIKVKPKIAMKDKLAGVKWDKRSKRFLFIQRIKTTNQQKKLIDKEIKGQPEKDSQLPLKPQKLTNKIKKNNFSLKIKSFEREKIFKLNQSQKKKLKLNQQKEIKNKIIKILKKEKKGSKSPKITIILNI